MSKESAKKLLISRYPNLGELQLDKIIEAHEDGYTWYDYCPHSYEVTMVREGSEGIDISREGNKQYKHDYEQQCEICGTVRAKSI